MSITLNVLVGRSVVPVVVGEVSLVDHIFDAVSNRASEDVRSLLKLVQAGDCRFYKIIQHIKIERRRGTRFVTDEVFSRVSSNQEEMEEYRAIKTYFNSSPDGDYIHIFLELPSNIGMILKLRILICDVLVSLPIDNHDFVWQLFDASRKLFPNILDKIKDSSPSKFEYKKLTSRVPLKFNPNGSFLATKETIEQCSTAEGEIMNAGSLLGDYFPLQPRLDENYVHVIINPLDNRLQHAIKKLEDCDRILYKSLQIRRTSSYDWSKEDFEQLLLASDSNVPPDMRDMQERLKQKRHIRNNAYVEAARQEFGDIFSIIFDLREGGQDNDAMEVEGVEPGNNVSTGLPDPKSGKHEVTGIEYPVSSENDDAKYKTEITIFSTLKEAFLREFGRFIGRNASSFLKQAAFIYNFVAFPAFVYEKRGRIEFTTGQKSKIVYYLEVPHGRTREVLGSYAPKSDFAIICKSHGCPFLLGEVDSNAGERDKYRMLAVAISATRVGQYLLKAGTTKLFVLMSIFLTKDLVVERYMVSQASSEDDHVVIVKQEFNLGNENDAFEFVRQMFNFGKFADEMAGELDPNKEKILVDMNDAGGSMPAYSSLSKRQGSGSHRGGSKESKSTERLRRQDGEQQYDEIGSNALKQDEDEDEHSRDCNLQNFWTRRDVCELLECIGCDTRDVVHVKDHPRIIYLPINDEGFVFIKYISYRYIRELKVLRYLYSFDPSCRYLVPFESWDIGRGALVKFPYAGYKVTNARNLDSNLINIALQLFESVAFLHAHNVAHRDIKPLNVMINDSGRLRIIDYSLAKQVESEDETYKGFVGTEGQVAPEIEMGIEWYSPVRADRWAVGLVVKKLCDLCVPSPQQDFLLDLSFRLMDINPSSRPSMQEALERLISFHDKSRNMEVTPSPEPIKAAYSSKLLRVR